MNEIELIQKHLTGKLAVAEQAAFHKRLAEEPLLQEKLAEYKIIMDGFRGMRTEAFEDEIKTWEQTAASGQSKAPTVPNPKSAESAKFFSLRSIAAAASILLLVGMGTWFLTSSGDPMQKILKQNEKFLAYEVKSDDGARGTNDESAFLIQLAQAHQYNKTKAYKKSAAALDLLLNQASTPETYKEELHWRKIVCLLNQFVLDQQESSKDALRQAIDQFLVVAKDEDIYKDKAKKLLQTL